MSRLFDSIKKKMFLSHVLGISREDHVLKIALITKEKGKVHVASCQTIPLEHKENLSSVLLSAQRIATGIELHEIVFRSLILPLKARRKVLDALPFQLETILPFPVDGTIICPFLKSADQHSTCVSIIATSKDIVKKHLSDWAAVDIRPDVVTCVPLALFRLARFLYLDQKDLLFFHFGEHKISCIVIQEGQLTLSQSIRLGIADLAEALALTFPDKTEKERQTQLYSPVKPYSTLASFQERLKGELERMSIFIKEKLRIPEEAPAMPWALIGEFSSSPALKEMWVKIFSDVPLPLDNRAIAEESLHSHGHAIGFALDALASDGRRIQFLQGEFIPVHHLLTRKKTSLIYAASCILLTAIVALSSTLALQKSTRALSDKLISCFPSSMEKKSLSISEIELELFKSEQSLSKQKNGFPFFLTLPKVSEVLAWLSTHSAFATADGLLKEGIDIKSLRYQLVKFPTLDTPSTPYHAIIDIEFTASTPRLAREFHDALLKGDRIVNAKKELKWNTQGNVYSVQFELNKSAIL